MLPTPPVTEFAILKVKHNSQHTEAELHTHLRRVSAEQSAWSSFPLHCFTYSDAPGPDTETFICILSQWSSVSAHQAWIDSEQNQALLTLLSPTIDIVSFCHIALNAKEEGGIDQVLGADKLGWKQRADDSADVVGDASGWAVDTPAPTFYSFKIVQDAGDKGDGWTIMSRLEL